MRIAYGRAILRNWLIGWHTAEYELGWPAGRSISRTTSAARVELSAAGSRDPDGDALSYRWITYPEAGSYRGLLAIQSADTPEASFVAPLVDGPQTIHLVLAVTDRGTPPSPDIGA